MSIKLEKQYAKRVQQITDTKLWVNKPIFSEVNKAMKYDEVITPIGFTTNPTWVEKLINKDQETNVYQVIDRHMASDVDDQAVMEKVQSVFVKKKRNNRIEKSRSPTKSKTKKRVSE